MLYSKIECMLSSSLRTGIANDCLAIDFQEVMTSSSLYVRGPGVLAGWAGGAMGPDVGSRGAAAGEAQCCAATTTPHAAGGSGSFASGPLAGGQAIYQDPQCGLG